MGKELLFNSLQHNLWEITSFSLLFLRSPTGMTTETQKGKRDDMKDKWAWAVIEATTLSVYLVFPSPCPEGMSPSTASLIMQGESFRPTAFLKMTTGCLFSFSNGIVVMGVHTKTFGEKVGIGRGEGKEWRHKEFSESKETIHVIALQRKSGLVKEILDIAAATTEIASSVT